MRRKKNLVMKRKIITTKKHNYLRKLHIKSLGIFIAVLCNSYIIAGEVNSWDCYKFNGARIVAEDNVFLGILGPAWMIDSIYNSNSSYGSTWSQNSIFNTSSTYGNNYSNESAFNEHANNPPKIYSKDNELIGFLSVSSSWNNEYYDPYDFKYTCDWD